MSAIEYEANPFQEVDIIPPHEFSESENVYECRVLLCPEPEGGYSVQACDLPGLVSQGDTEDDALDNIREAFRGVAAAYLEERGTIPWTPRGSVDVENVPGAKERWILVDV